MTSLSLLAGRTVGLHLRVSLYDQSVLSNSCNKLARTICQSYPKDIPNAPLLCKNSAKIPFTLSKMSLYMDEMITRSHQVNNMMLLISNIAYTFHSSSLYGLWYVCTIFDLKQSLHRQIPNKVYVSIHLKMNHMKDC